MALFSLSLSFSPLFLISLHPWCLSMVVYTAWPCFPVPDCIVRTRLVVYIQKNICSFTYISAVLGTVMYKFKRYELYYSIMRDETTFQITKSIGKTMRNQVAYLLLHKFVVHKFGYSLRFMKWGSMNSSVVRCFLWIVYSDDDFQTHLC